MENNRNPLEDLFASPEKQADSSKDTMRIANDLAVFLEHPELLIVVIFLIAFTKEAVRAVGL